MKRCAYSLLELNAKGGQMGKTVSKYRSTDILCRISPQLLFSLQNASWFLIPKVHRMYVSLNIFFDQCLYRKNLY